MSSKPSRYFNPRSPCGERHYTVNNAEVVQTFQPTLPVRGATPASARSWRYVEDFNPRSPCGERHEIVAGQANVNQFQPTLPVRGATQHLSAQDTAFPNFNPRSPCGERPVRHKRRVHVRPISTHAPRAGSDFPGFLPSQISPISTHAPRAGSDPPRDV